MALWCRRPHPHQISNWLASRPRAATQALARLLGQGNEVYLTPQNFIEFWPWRLVPWKGTASDGPANGPQKKLLICRNVFRSLARGTSLTCTRLSEERACSPLACPGRRQEIGGYRGKGPARFSR